MNFWIDPWDGFLPPRTMLMLRHQQRIELEVATQIRASQTKLDATQADLEGCVRCDLCKERKSIVFGEGAPKARLAFIGGSPGAAEDRLGHPFQGAAGNLLDRMIQAMGFQRSEVYFANIVKCRPSRDRNPIADEIAACQPFLTRQLAAVSPQIVVALGELATQSLLGTAAPFSHLRGKFHAMELNSSTVQVMPTFHPEYLRRNPAAKKVAWSDLLQVVTSLSELKKG